MTKRLSISYSLYFSLLRVVAFITIFGVEEAGAFNIDLEQEKPDYYSTLQHNGSASLGPSDDSGNPTSVVAFTKGEDSDQDFKKRPYPPQMQTSSPIELHLIALIEALSNLNITSLPLLRKGGQGVPVGQGAGSADGNNEPSSSESSDNHRAGTGSGNNQGDRDDPSKEVRHVHLPQGDHCPAPGCDGNLCRCSQCVSVPKPTKCQPGEGDEALPSLCNNLSINISGLGSVQNIYFTSNGRYVVVTWDGVYILNTSDNMHISGENRMPIERIGGTMLACGLLNNISPVTLTVIKGGYPAPGQLQVTAWVMENEEWRHDILANINEHEFKKDGGTTCTVSQLVVLSNNAMIVMHSGYSRLLFFNESWQWSPYVYSNSIEIIAIPQPERDKTPSSAEDSTSDDLSILSQPIIGVAAIDSRIVTFVDRPESVDTFSTSVGYSLNFPTAMIPAGPQHLIVIPSSSTQKNDRVKIGQHLDDGWQFVETPFTTAKYAISPTVLVVIDYDNKSAAIHENKEGEWQEVFSFHVDGGSIHQLIEGGLVYIPFHEKPQTGSSYQYTFSLIYSNAGVWKKYDQIIEFGGDKAEEIIALPNQSFAVSTKNVIRIFNYKLP